MLAALFQLGKPFLSNYYDGSCQQSKQADYALEPEKWRRVERLHVQHCRNGTRENPREHKQEDAADINWPANDIADGFNDALRPCNFFVFAFIKRRDHFNILRDWIRRFHGRVHVGFARENLDDSHSSTDRRGKVRGFKAAPLPRGRNSKLRVNPEREVGADRRGSQRLAPSCTSSGKWYGRSIGRLNCKAFVFGDDLGTQKHQRGRNLQAQQNRYGRRQ